MSLISKTIKLSCVISICKFSFFLGNSESMDCDGKTKKFSGAWLWLQASAVVSTVVCVP